MGYESRIYIVDKGNIKNTEGLRWASVIATFEMGKYPELADLFKKSKKTDCYIYADDGNTEIIKDRYDEFLTEANIDDVIAVLENGVYTETPYRRTLPLLVTLESIKCQIETGYWTDIGILHYGY